MSTLDADDAVRTLTPGISGYVVLIGLGFWRPTIAVIGFLLIAVFFLIPFPIRGRDDSARGVQRFG